MDVNGQRWILEDLDLKAVAIDAIRRIFALAQRDAKLRKLRQIDPATLDGLVDRFVVVLAKERTLLDLTKGPPR